MHLSGKRIAGFSIGFIAIAGLFLIGVHLGAKAEAMGGPVTAIARIVSYLRTPSRFGKFGKTYEGTVKQEALRCRQFHNAVIFIGDSNTFGLATSNIAPRAENLGVNGDTAEHVLYRLASCDLHRARAVVMAIGTNDWPYARFAGFGGRYTAILHAVPSNVPVLAAAILPVNEARLSEFYDTRGMLQGIANANAEIASSCRARPRCVFVPVPPSLIRRGQLAEWADAGEGIHLSPKGYTIWGTSLAAALAKAGVRQEKNFN